MELPARPEQGEGCPLSQGAGGQSSCSCPVLQAWRLLEAARISARWTQGPQGSPEPQELPTAVSRGTEQREREEPGHTTSVVWTLWATTRPILPTPAGLPFLLRPLLPPLHTHTQHGEVREGGDWLESLAWGPAMSTII